MHRIMWLVGLNFRHQISTTKRGEFEMGFVPIEQVLADINAKIEKQRERRKVGRDIMKQVRRTQNKKR
jgi:hypothetical protein